MEHSVLLSPGVFIVGTLYGAVGHGGASGYLALMSLMNVPQQAAASTALILNLVVAGIAFQSYAQAGHFRWRLTWPFLLASVPLAFLGGLLKPPVQVYELLLMVALAGAAVRLLAPKVQANTSLPPVIPKLPVILLTGGVLGFAAGVVGIGGGIFLSPVMILLRWADARQTSATAACFILANSAAGLAGRLTHGSLPLLELWPLVVAGALGGWLGSRYGALKAPNPVLCRILAAVLLIAAAKLILHFF